MKQKIEQADFDKMTSETANELLTELLTYSGDEFKDLVVSIIDNTAISENEMNTNIEVIFNNERVRTIIDELLSEYDSQD